jgi:hypothetical protein
MSYRHARRHGLSFNGLPSLGIVDAESARARRLNEDQGVSALRVGPGFWDGWIDAALSVHGIPSNRADELPGVVREILRAAGSPVDRVLWGGGSGLEDARGKVYVRWKPNAPYNAVTYADIARRLFMRAADGFPAGSRVVMHRYRIPGGWLSRDKFVYPENGPIPASAPEAARLTNAGDLDIGVPQLEIESILSGDAAKATVIGVSVGAGALLLVGGGLLIYRARRKR